MLPRHEYAKGKQQGFRDGLTVAEFFDYLTALAETHEDTAQELGNKPVLTHRDFARLLRNIAKRLRP